MANKDFQERGKTRLEEGGFSVSVTNTYILFLQYTN